MSFVAGFRCQKVCSDLMSCECAKNLKKGKIEIILLKIENREIDELSEAVMQMNLNSGLQYD